MGAILLQNIRKQFDTQVVLDNVSLELRAREIVGLVGANGSGKTTLLRLAAGLLDPDLGTIRRSRGTEVGYLAQEPDVDLDRTLHEEVGSAFAGLLALESRIHDLSEEIAARHDDADAGELMRRLDRLHTEFEIAGGYTFVQRMNEVLGGLGFTQQDHHLPVSVLSGGQKCRAALAKLLLKDSTYLLLDEPTNHLDIDAVRWLEKFLAAHTGGALIVSHDRYLLDRVVDRIVELERRGVVSYPGNYSNYVRTRELRRLTQERQYEQDRSFIEKERAFVARHLAGQRTKEAQGRRTRLERRLADGEFVLEKPRTARRVRLSFAEVDTADSTVLRVDDLAKSYGDRTLFTDLTFQVFAQECFAITGPNGTGKSTLLKILLDQVSPDCGRVELGRKIAPGYYAQEAADLQSDKTVLEDICETCPHFSEQDARSCVARFQFTGDDVFKRVDRLSGGEQSRLRLLKLILSAPNVLVLDEPTNHLDIASREVLEEALIAFTGTIVVVSHDRYFLDRVADRLLVLGREGHALYAGNYSYYLETVESPGFTARDATPDPRPAPGAGSGSKSKSKSKSKSAPAPPAKARSSSQTRMFDRLSVEQIEEYIVEREEQIAALHERFGDPDVCRDPLAMAELNDQIEALQSELAVAEQCWEERADS